MARDYLSFKDWISTGEHRKADWVILSQWDKLGAAEMKATFSALTPNNDEALKKILSHSDWDVSLDLGHPTFRKQGDTVILDRGDTDSLDGLNFEAFTIYRNFHEAFESGFEIAQNFILYHNLHYDPDQCVFSDPTREQDVVECVDPMTLRVKPDYLKEYLAARGMALVRFHDHRRFMKKSVQSAIGKEFDDITIQSGDQCYDIHIGASLNRNEVFSRLLGKDVIFPFKEPSHEDYRFLSGTDSKQFATFVVGKKNTGQNVESTCEEKVLSNYFEDRGTPHFLTPIFFKREVLQKYYSRPRIYTVTSGSLSHLDLWYVPFGINEEGLIHVWLGDLGRIPYEEQQHWRLYNVQPSGGLEEAFAKRQLLAEFAESKDPIDLLHQAREQTNELFSKRFGFHLFRDLSKDDSYVQKSIHLPTADEQKEFDEQLLYLAKYLVDSLNKHELEQRVKWKPASASENTHIRLMEVFLIEVLGIELALAKQVADPFRVLQSLRSKSAAHTKSEEFRRELEKLGMARLRPKKAVEKLVGLVTASLSTIQSSVRANK